MYTRCTVILAVLLLSACVGTTTNFFNGDKAIGKGEIKTAPEPEKTQKKDAP